MYIYTYNIYIYLYIYVYVWALKILVTNLMFFLPQNLCLLK